MILSGCVEWLFANEAADIGQRIRLAKAAGLDGVEFWKWSNKDLDAVEAALAETGLPLFAMVAEPMIPLTDKRNRDTFVERLSDTLAVARRLGVRSLITQAGADQKDVPRQQQRDAVIEALALAAPLLAGSGIRLGLEPLNTTVDHAGYFLPSTLEAIEIVDAVDRAEVGIVYDLYHSGVMDEDYEAVIEAVASRVVHAHVADHPGRNEPGAGKLDLGKRIAYLARAGYDGPIGLEFRPTGATVDAIRQSRRVLAGVG